MNEIIRFIKNEEAATAVEYAVMIGLILAAAITSISQMGVKTGAAFSNFESTMP